MKKIASYLVSGLAASLLAVSVSACGGTTADDTVDATLTVRNDSDYDITELYLTLSVSSGWGPDLLNGNDLQPDDSIQLDVSCDTYDVKFVDETGVSCEQDDVDLCFSDSIWTITNSTCDFTDFRKGTKTVGNHPPRVKNASK